MKILNILKLYGTRGRMVSGLGLIVIIIGSLQAGGAFELLPPKVTLVLMVISAVALSLSERITGGASKPEIREAAEASDRKNELESR